jgi:hypothetical protein
VPEKVLTIFEPHADGSQAPPERMTQIVDPHPPEQVDFGVGDVMVPPARG